MIVDDPDGKRDLSCLVVGFGCGAIFAGCVVWLGWAAVYDKHLAADRQADLDRAKAVQAKIVDNANLSHTLEKGLIADASKTVTAVAKAKSRIQQTPWIVPAKCEGGYIIQVGAEPSDLWRAYVAGRDGVLYPDGIRSGAGVHATDDTGDMPAAAAEP